MRAEVLLRGATSKLEKSPGFAPLVGKALDDQDADVRRIAYVVTVLEQPALVAWLEAKDEAFVRAMHDVYRRIREIETGKTGEPSDAEGKAIRARLTDAAGAPANLDEKQREPLLALLACRTADTSLRGARGLALLGDMRALGALLTISRDARSGPAPRVGARARRARTIPRAKRRLVWMLNDADPQVRDAAFECTRGARAERARARASRPSRLRGRRPRARARRPRQARQGRGRRRVAAR